jgi:hypothetical protein
MKLTDRMNTKAQLERLGFFMPASLVLHGRRRDNSNDVLLLAAREFGDTLKVFPQLPGGRLLHCAATLPPFVFSKLAILMPGMSPASASRPTGAASRTVPQSSQANQTQEDTEEETAKAGLIPLGINMVGACGFEPQTPTVSR